MKPPIEQPAGLIAVLLDVSAPFGDRDDAAMDLAAFGEPAAEAALLKIVLDPSEDEDLADSAGESLREIWTRAGKHDASAVAQMHPAARRHFDEG